MLLKILILKEGNIHIKSKMLEINWWCISWKKIRGSIGILKREYGIIGEDRIELQYCHEIEVYIIQHKREKDLLEFELKHNLRP